MHPAVLALLASFVLPAAVQAQEREAPPAGPESVSFRSNKDYVRQVLAAQEARYRTTGQVTVVSEDAVPVAPHYFYYYTIHDSGEDFAVVARDGSLTLPLDVLDSVPPGSLLRVTVGEDGSVRLEPTEGAA